MSGVTKHIYERDIIDINVMWNKELKEIEKILPRTYGDDDILLLPVHIAEGQTDHLHIRFSGILHYFLGRVVHSILSLKPKHTKIKNRSSENGCVTPPMNVHVHGLHLTTSSISCQWKSIPSHPNLEIFSKFPLDKRQLCVYITPHEKALTPQRISLTRQRLFFFITFLS